MQCYFSLDYVLIRGGMMYGLDLSSALFAAGILFCFAAGGINWFSFKEPIPRAVLALWLIASIVLSIMTIVNFVLYSDLVIQK